MIVVFTPVHGITDIWQDVIKAIDNELEDFIHYIGDDFSNEEDSQALQSFMGTVKRDGRTVGQRTYYHCSELGCTESPNLGQSLGFMFDIARQYDAEALFSIESDVIIRPGIVSAFRRAQREWGPKCGMVAPLYTRIGENELASYGGISAPSEPRYLNIPLGTPIGAWSNPEVPRVASILWSHLAATWITRNTLLSGKVFPDPEFRLYHCDHDLSHQVKDCAGLDIVLTSLAVAEHTRCSASTAKRWPDSTERHQQELSSYQQLKQKWSI